MMAVIGGRVRRVSTEVVSLRILRSGIETLIWRLRICGLPLRVCGLSLPIGRFALCVAATQRGRLFGIALRGGIRRSAALRQILSELRIRSVALLWRIGRLSVILWRLRRRLVSAGGRPRQLCGWMAVLRLASRWNVVARLRAELRPTELRIGRMARGAVGPWESVIDRLRWARGATLWNARSILIIRSCHNALSLGPVDVR